MEHMDQSTLYYVVNARMPTEKAHGLQIAKMCAAFAAGGQKVVLLVPKRGAGSAEAIYETYKVAPSFGVEFLPTLQVPVWVPGSFLLQSAAFAIAAAHRLNSLKNVIAYTRGESILLFGRLLSKKVPLIWETHIKPDRAYRYKKVAQVARALVTVTTYYEKEIPGLWEVEESKVICDPDAVSLEDFQNPEPKAESRARLGLSQDKKVALYIGRVDGWKGLDMLCDAAEFLTNGVQVAIIGGEPDQVADLRTKYPKVMFLGYSPYEQLANNQAAADVLVLTGNPASEIAQHYTSPLKLFTYMASNVPVVAVDLPSYRDILSEQTAFFSKPSAQELAQTIEYAVTHTEEAQIRADAAHALVQQYSWEARARRILDHIAITTT